ncbi:MAG: response regulator [Candidatus Rokubacteria bacterium]|nr:response regulator [Candidatus Rokubacteria bacterium]
MESAVAVSIPQETRAGRILVVDDEAEVGEVLREYLASRGHAVSAFSDAEAALARLEGEWFDLVITDLDRLGGRQARQASQPRDPRHAPHRLGGAVEPRRGPGEGRGLRAGETVRLRERPGGAGGSPRALARRTPPERPRRRRGARTPGGARVPGLTSTCTAPSGAPRHRTSIVRGSPRARGGARKSSTTRSTGRRAWCRGSRRARRYRAGAPG